MGHETCSKGVFHLQICQEISKHWKVIRVVADLRFSYQWRVYYEKSNQNVKKVSREKNWWNRERNRDKDTEREKEGDWDWREKHRKLLNWKRDGLRKAKRNIVTERIEFNERERKGITRDKKRVIERKRELKSIEMVNKSHNHFSKTYILWSKNEKTKLSNFILEKKLIIWTHLRHLPELDHDYLVNYLT